MAFQAVPNTAEAVIRYSIQGVLVTNTFYARRNTMYNLQNLVDLATAVDDWVGTQALPTMSNQLEYQATVVRGLALENDNEVVTNVSTGFGSNAGTPLPNNCAFAVARTSGLTGRSARGRVFWPGMTVNNLSTVENFVTTGYASVVTDVLNALRALLDLIGWIEVIVSRYANGAKRSEAVTFDVVNYTATDLRVDSQRARMI